jgi:hypothetical protein
MFAFLVGISTGLIAVVGDLVVQLTDLSSKVDLADVPNNIDVRRLLEFFAVNVLFIGPALHIWFNALSKMKIPEFATKNKYTRAGYQIFIDQTVGATWITTGFFVCYEVVRKVLDAVKNLVTFSGSYSPTDLVQWFSELFFSIGVSISLRLWTTLVVGRLYWPIINFVNFVFVPLELR